MKITYPLVLLSSLNEMGHKSGSVSCPCECKLEANTAKEAPHVCLSSNASDSADIS